MNYDRPAPKQYETWLKQLLQLRFEQARFKVEKELTVGELPLRIDMVASKASAADFAELPEIFGYFRSYNVMQIKTEADDLTADDLLKLHAYGWLYMELNHIYTIREVTLTALVHHLTPAVLKILPTLGYVQVKEGVYQQAPSAMASLLICFGALPDEVTPEELRAFSNPARRRPIIVSELERGKSTPLLEAIVELSESEVFKIMAVKQETIQRYIDALGREKFLAALSKEEHMSVLSKEDYLAALSKQDLLSALSEEDLFKELLAKLGANQLQQMLAQISTPKSEQN